MSTHVPVSSPGRLASLRKFVRILVGKPRGQHPPGATGAKGPGDDPEGRDGHTQLRGLIGAERVAIAARRDSVYTAKTDPKEVAKDSVGLALSGGGIRSATFNLGLIQALHHEKIFGHVDYLITISGGGYTGANLAKHAARAASAYEEEASRKPAPPGGPRGGEGGDAGRPPDWFPYPIREDGRQDPRLLDFYKRGDYIDRPVQLAFIWLPGTVLNVVMLFGGLMALCAAVAFLFRIVDFPLSDEILRWACRSGLLGLAGLESGMDRRLEGVLPRWAIDCHAAMLLLVVGVMLVPPLLRRVGDEPDKSRRLQGSVASRWKRVFRRTGRMMTWPMVLLSLTCWGVLWLEWPTQGQARGVIGRLPGGPERAKVVNGAVLADRFLTEWTPPAHLSAAFGEASSRAGYVLGLLSGEPERTRWALLQIDRDDRAKADRPWSEDTPVEESQTLIRGMDEGTLWLAADRKLPDALDDLDSAAAKVPKGSWPDLRPGWPHARPHFAFPLTEETLFDVLVHARALEINSLIVTDLLRAMLPALMALLVYLAYRSIRGVRGASKRRPGDARDRLARFCWVLLGLGLLVALSNGDTDIGFFKYLLPSVPGVEAIVDEDSGVVSGGRVTLTGALSMVRSLAFTVPALLASMMALIPLVSRDRFLKSAEQPKDTAQGKFFRFLVSAVVIVLPLACFVFLVRENVSGAAPVIPADAKSPPAGQATAVPGPEAKAKAKAKSAPPSKAQPGKGQPVERVRGEVGPHVQVARMAYCPESRFGHRNYLIVDDQLARLLIFAASVSTFLFLAWTVNLNHTSIHTFYRDRLYEAYLADKPREPRAKYRLASLDGTAVGFPHHLIAATLNQFRSADDPKDCQHEFIFSRLYCGSEPTGYRRTDRYRNGVFLADAMAISGAAISPVQARSVVARLVMLVLNMRLGQWYPNPHPVYDPGRRVRPNLIHLLFDHSYLLGGPSPRFAWRRLKKSLTLLGRRGPRLPKGFLPAFRKRHESEEPRRFCFLSDGAHYDNLGIELLLQRRCRLMIVSDVSHDPELACDDLVASFRRARARHGIDFEPLWMTDVRGRLGLDISKIHTNPDRNLDPFRFRSPGEAGDAKSSIAKRMVRENFLVGKVTYPADPKDAGANLEGILVLIKPSLTAELADHPEILQYIQSNVDFPHDTDMEQVFDEVRVEAYRQLGQCVGEALARVIQPPAETPDAARAALMNVVATLLEPAAPAPEKPESNREAYQWLSERLGEALAKFIREPGESSDAARQRLSEIGDILFDPKAPARATNGRHDETARPAAGPA